MEVIIDTAMVFTRQLSLLSVTWQNLKYVIIIIVMMMVMVVVVVKMMMMMMMMTIIIIIIIMTTTTIITSVCLTSCFDYKSKEL